MKKRTSADITIKRKIGTRTLAIQKVPITEKSVRRFSLMHDDFIQLDFSLAEAVYFAIGDFVDDEIFGRFVITEEQMPRFNTSTGGCDYTLKLEREYLMWKNWLFCLIADGRRMESRWSLTDKLENQAQQIADNVNLMVGASITERYDTQTGITVYNSTGYGISVTAEKAIEVKFLSFEGTDIISAMNAIADAWECEWWVTDDRITVGNTTYAHTIHFGKCELSNDPFDFELGVNVESMDINRDQQTYANRVFAYGGTQNIPEDYDRKLEFVCDSHDAANRLWGDSLRPLKLNMIEVQEIAAVYDLMPLSSPVRKNGSSTSTFTIESQERKVLPPGTYNVIVNIGSQLDTPNISPELIDNLDVSARVRLFFPTEILLEDRQRIKPIDGHWDIASYLDLSIRLDEEAPVYISIEWVVIWEHTGGESEPVNILTTGDITATGSHRASSKQIVVTFDGADYPATLNPLNLESGEQAYMFRFDTEPSGFDIGSVFTVSPLSYDVPYSYYTEIYDTGVLSKVGERRLHLPLTSVEGAEAYPNRYAPNGDIDPTRLVEECIIFEDVFPKLKLIVTSVRTNERQEDITHDDSSVERQYWVQYFITARFEDNTPFTFNTRYIMDGNKLQIAFTSPENMQSSGFMLAGMTFDCGFNNYSQEYMIVRNEEYGGKIPNGVLKPSVGDTFFLTGWNPRALTALDLVSRAEQELAGKTRDYLDALKEGQFSFLCKMMSDWLFQIDGQALVDSDGKNLLDRNGNVVHAFNGLSSASLLNAGTRVTIHHNALPVATVNGEARHAKTSRIIGYEYKLDKPFDSPSFTVGETDAYSRLKKIEKEITRLS